LIGSLNLRLRAIFQIPGETVTISAYAHLRDALYQLGVNAAAPYRPKAVDFMMFFSRQMPKISGRIDENRQKYKFTSPTTSGTS
jgi:hypothetical protein